MKLYISALVLLLVPIMISAHEHEASCSMDQTIRTIVAQQIAKINFECVSANERSSYASCPAGYTATSCACGMACGSWDIQVPNKCHCQCGGMDWTTATCCRIKTQ